MLKSLLGALAFSALAFPAFGQTAGVAVGASACAIKCASGNRDAGGNLSIQWTMEPTNLSLLGSPQPYLIASLNTAGETSFAGIGLEWPISLTSDWTFSPGLGYVIHDGELDNTSGQPAEHALMGSRDLFRLSLTITRNLPGPWQTQMFMEHLSHGQIIGSGRNQGIDQVGARLAYRFD